MQPMLWWPDFRVSVAIWYYFTVLLILLGGESGQLFKFQKRGNVGLGYSLMIIKCTWSCFSLKLQNISQPYISALKSIVGLQINEHSRGWWSRMNS